MPQLLTSRRVRCSAIVGSVFASSPLTDVFTAQNIETVRGNATRFEFGFFDFSGVAMDLSSVESLNLKIQPDQVTPGVLADKTISVLDLTMDAESWADGTKEHALFELSNAEMNIDPDTTSRPLWLVVTAITTAGDEVTLCGGTLLLKEDNNGTADPPPEFPGTSITLEQADARYLHIGDEQPITPEQQEIALNNLGFNAADSGMKFVKNSSDTYELALWNDTQSIYQILRITGAAGSEQITFHPLP